MEAESHFSPAGKTSVKQVDTIPADHRRDTYPLLALKSPKETQETQVRSLGQEDALEEEMKTHSSILTWKVPQTEEPGGLQSMGLQGIGHNLATEPHNSSN